MKLGEAIAQAMDMWNKRKAGKQRARLLEIEPFDSGEGTEKVSVEISSGCEVHVETVTRDHGIRDARAISKPKPLIWKQAYSPDPAHGLEA